jgi:hypothetical protein
MLPALVGSLLIAGAASAYEVVDVSNAGAIMGSVSVSDIDTELLDETLYVYRNQRYCGKFVPAERYLVSANGRLQNSVVMIDKITRGKPWGPRGDFVITNDKCRFVPHVLVARKGGTMKLKNDDPMLHNFHFYRVGLRFDRNVVNLALPTVGLEIRKNKILRESGLLSLKCDAHGYMQAWVWVVEHPYAAVTPADGTFTLDGVPPGRYLLRVWHELLGEKVVGVTVEAGKTASVHVTF